MAKINDQLSSAFTAIPEMLSPARSRPLQRGDEITQQLEEQHGPVQPHIGAEEGLTLAGELFGNVEARMIAPTCHSSSQ